MVSSRTLEQLERECAEKGIVVQFPIAKNGKIKKGKKECILALRDYYLLQRYSEGKIPLHLQIMMEIETPMLCDRFHSKTEDIQKEILSSSDWGYQEKMNGCRMVFIFVKSEGLHFYSRGVSVTDYLPVEYKNIFLGEDHSEIERILGLSFDSFAIDTEVISTSPSISTILQSRGVITETMLQAVSALLALNDEDSLRIQREEGCPLKFCVFDCFYYNGERLYEGFKNMIQVNREKVAGFIVLTIQEKMNIVMLQTVYDADSKALYMKSIIDSGGEGVVAKHKNSLYRPVEARSRNLWVKIKRSVSGSLTSTDYGDTLDAFVTGFELGDEDRGYKDLVGSLVFSIWLIGPTGERNLHEIAKVPSIALEMRKAITTIDELGRPVLIQDMYNKVAAVDGQAISARARRLSHPRILEWRTDKLPEQCELQEEFLNKMIV